ncbi:hypothetical protein C8J31_105309 [Rhizobium sp. PP-CC-2G-626]|nr:hypothetical protein C8J31_105309 [Rhizobium sp. PP-CC-2G-626]
MTYFATYLGTASSTEKTEVEAALRLSVFGDTPFTLKPPGNGRGGIMDAKYDDTTGYIFHLRAGPNSGGLAGAIGIGTDEGLGGGLLISHKNASWGLNIVNNPGAGLGAYITGYTANPALQMDLYAGAGGIKLQPKTGAGFKDGVTNAGSTTFTSASATFTAGDVGQTIAQLTSVGASSPIGSIPASTTISAVVDGQTVTLSQAATASGTGIRFRVGGRAVPASQPVLSLFDADGTTLRGAILYGLFDWRTPVKVTNNATSIVALTAKGAAGQTADVLNILNSADAQLFRVQSSGRITAAYSSFFSNAGKTDQPVMQLAGYAATLPVAQFSQETSSGTGDFIQMLNFADQVVSRVNYGGYVMTRKTSAPAAVDVVNAELTFWYDEANAKFKITAKNAAGVLVSGEVALS